MVLTVLRDAWAQIVSSALGIWLMASPSVLGYVGTAGTVHRIVGPVVASLAFVAIWGHMRSLRWGGLVFGALLVVLAPVLGFGRPALVNSVVVGVLLVGLAFVRGRIRETYGGGWTSLLTGRGGGQ